MEREFDAACVVPRKPRTRPFCIRLTDEEKDLLSDRAGKLPLGVYIRGMILASDEQSPRPRQRNPRTPVKDHGALARVLSALGQSRIANNLNQLAKAVNIGVLPVSPETEQDIGEACSAVSAMRNALIVALGLKTEDRP